MGRIESLAAGFFFFFTQFEISYIKYEVNPLNQSPLGTVTSLSHSQLNIPSEVLLRRWELKNQYCKNGFWELSICLSVYSLLSKMYLLLDVSSKQPLNILNRCLNKKSSQMISIFCGRLKGSLKKGVEARVFFLLLRWLLLVLRNNRYYLLLPKVSDLLTALEHGFQFSFLTEDLIKR